MKGAKRIFIVILTVTIGIMAALTLAACRHEHDFAGLRSISPDGTPCDQREYEKFCDCGETQPVNGSVSDHVWGTEYLYDSFSHWFECKKCGAKNAGNHDANYDGKCLECDQFAATVGLGYAFTESGDGYIASGYIGNAENVVIPNVYQGKPVIAIAAGAFKNNMNILSVTFGDSITTIGAEAFYGCSMLGYIEMGNNVTGIGNYAFYDCVRLSVIDIPQGVTSIGNYIFYGCEGLAFIELPQGITSIGDYAFYNCKNLNFINIPQGVTSIGECTFAGCDSLETVEFGDNVTSISIYAFWRCTALTSITVSENNAVYKSIDGDLYSKDGTVLIQYAIGKADTEFILPESVTSIGDYAFYYSANLESLIIEDGLTSIGNYAFAYASALENLEIPDSLTSIGASAFEGCENIAYNEYDDVFYLGSINNPYVLLVKAETDSIVACTVNPNTKIVYNRAFEDCYRLESIEIPESVVSIGEYAFGGCTALTSITVSENNAVYKSIDGDLYSKDGTVLIQYALGKADTEFILPEFVKVIGDNAFYCSTNLESIIIGSVESIGDGAFGGCLRLTSVIIGSVENIGRYVLIESKNLANLVIGSVKNISERAFDEIHYFEKLTKVVIGSVERIGNYAFYGCGRLERVYFGGTEIEWSLVEIDEGNEDLTGAKIYYYSESEPTEKGNYWHYDADGKIVVW